MYFQILLGYLLGYVTIQIEGYFIERFINLCNSQKIFLWNLQRINSTSIKVNMNIRDFKTIKQIAKKTKCRVKIKNKKGIPFLLHRYKKRKIFVLFFLLIIIAIFTLSNFIWNIEITGNETIPKQEIQQILEKHHFNIGSCKIGLQTKNIIEQIRLERDDIAWVGIEIKGTNAIVKIVEADLKPEIIPEEEYCNLIATKEGMIVKVTAQNGTPLVKEGDLVTKGSVLVGGWLEGKYTGMRYVHANGEVKAKVWYSQKVEVPLKQVKKVKTGNEEHKYSVKINNFEINLSKGVSKFQNYDTIETSKKLKLFSDFYFPIEIQEKTYQEYEKQEITYTVEEAKQIGIEQAEQKLEEQIASINQNENIQPVIKNDTTQNGEQEENEKLNKVLEKQVHTKQVGDAIEVEVIYEVLENIATKEKLVF